MATYTIDNCRCADVCGCGIMTCVFVGPSSAFIEARLHLEGGPFKYTGNIMFSISKSGNIYSGDSGGFHFKYDTTSGIITLSNDTKTVNYSGIFTPDGHGFEAKDCWYEL